MTVFIHIGCSKTGTTSIQRAMGQHANRLRVEYSINYPRSSPTHWPIALPFLGGQEFEPLDNHLLRGLATREEVWQRAQRLLANLKENASRYPVHVISAEQLALLNPASARRLKSFFDQLGLATKIIIYVRHPADRISSLISQKVRGGRESLRTVPVADGVLGTLRTYAEVFGKGEMIVRRFGSQYFAHGNLMDDFTSIFHGTPIPGVSSPRHNESLSLPAVLIADQLFDIAPVTSGKRGNEKYLNRIAGPKFLAPRAAVERAIEVNRPWLDYVETEFGIQFDPVDLSVFPEMITREFSDETLTSLAMLLNDQVVAITQLEAEVERLRKLLSRN